MADTWGTLAPPAWTRAVMSHPLGAAVYNAYQQGDRAGILGLVPENVRRAWSPLLLPLANPVAFMDTFSPGAAVRDTLEASGNLSRSVMRGDPWGALGATGMGILAMAGVVPWFAPAKVAATPTQGAARAVAPVAATDGRGSAKAMAPDVPLAPPPAGVQNASRNVTIFDPLRQPQRAFTRDYPQGARSDATGRLTHDIEGREIVADRAVGRRVVGGGDVALPQTELVPVATSITGRAPESLPPREIGRGIVGRYREWFNPVTGNRERGIALSRALSAADLPRVLGHELGHAIAEAAGPIPTKNTVKQLRDVYNTLNNPRDWLRSPGQTSLLYGPEQAGYKGTAVHDELWAEAIRAYMADPNYLKSVAPKVAERIREYVNPNPRINRAIQFNSMLPAVNAGRHKPMEAT